MKFKLAKKFVAQSTHTDRAAEIIWLSARHNVFSVSQRA